MGDFDQAAGNLEKAVALDGESTYLKRELALLYLKKKDPARALATMKTALEAHPDHVATLILYGKIEQEQKNLKAAKDAYEKIVTLDPKQKNIYLILGAIYMEEEAFEDALRVYKSLAVQFPENYAGYFLLGKTYLKKLKYEDAETAFRQSLALEPDLDVARYALIDALKGQGKTDDIYKMYQTIIKNNPESIRSTMELGYYYHQNNNRVEALKWFKKLGVRSVSDEEVIRQVFHLYLDKKDYAPAIMILRGMLAGAPDNSDIRYLMGIALDGNKEKENALSHLEQVRPDSKFYQNAMVHIAFLYQELGRIDAAIAHLVHMIKKLPEAPSLYLYLGSFYEDTEAYDQAVDILKRGLEKDPDNGKILFRLGVIYDKWNRKEDSMKTMREVIRVDPKNANALNYLGYTYADLGQNLDEAEQLIKEAMRHKPNDGYITDSLGWVYYKQGRFKEALEMLTKAIVLVPGDPVILEHLGDIHVKMNDIEKALQYYQKSLDLRKKDREVIEQKIHELVNSDQKTPNS